MLADMARLPHSIKNSFSSKQPTLNLPCITKEIVRF
jgi:hypothetical protein